MRYPLPLAFLLLACTCAAQPAPLPAGGQAALPPDALAAFRLTGDTFGALELVPAPTDAPPPNGATRVLRLRTDSGAPQAWSIEARQPVAGPVAVGDVLHLRVLARATQFPPESGEARIGFNIQVQGPPWDKPLSGEHGIPPRWTWFDLPLLVERVDPRGFEVTFHLGFPRQTVEIAACELTNFGRAVALDALPITRVTYAGREADAPWRAAAAERIRRIRMRDVVIEVVGPDGAPRAGVPVRLEQRRHAFGFGTAVNAARVLEEGPVGDRYRAEILRLFNTSVIENHLKWPFYESWGAEVGGAAVDWLRAHGLTVRGHVMVWPGFDNLPDDVAGLAGDPAALRERIRGRILGIGGAFRGRLHEWDVINEPFSNHDLMRVLGNEAMVEWFRLAQEAAPDARLYLNDYPLPDSVRLGQGHLGHFEETIRFLLDRGAPLQGIGIQGHFGVSGVPPERVVAALDHFARFGLPIAITEYDVSTRDEEMKRDYLRDFYTACFSHPAVNQIMMWGFWEGAHWRPEAAMFRRDWSRTPMLEMYEELVFGAWWSRAEGVTDAEGRFRTRVFLGEHNVASGDAAGTLTIPRADDVPFVWRLGPDGGS